MQRIIPALFVILIAAVLPTLSACDAGPKGNLIYRATLPDGTKPGDDVMLTLEAMIDGRIGRHGIKRREVMVMPPDRIRVVLPESVVPRMAEIRGVIENPEDLPATLTLISGGGL